MTNPELQAENQQLRAKIQQLTARVAELENPKAKSKDEAFVKGIEHAHESKKVDKGKTYS